MSNTAPEQEYDTRLAYSSSRALRIAVALLLLYCILKFIGSPLVPPVYTIETEQLLPASVENSWQALTDLSSYSQWNSYLPAIEGKFEVGEKLILTLVAKPGIAPRESHAVLAEIETDKYFAWHGQQFPLPGISHTRHVFALEAREDGQTLLRHYEEFRGLAVALDDSGRDAEIKRNQAAFTRMNTALQARLGQ